MNLIVLNYELFCEYGVTSWIVNQQLRHLFVHVYMHYIYSLLQSKSIIGYLYLVIVILYLSQ